MNRLSVVVLSALLAVGAPCVAQSREALFKQVEVLAQEKKWAEAEALCEKATLQDAKDPHGWLVRATLREAQGNLSGAIDDETVALVRMALRSTASTERASVYLRRAEAWLKKGEPQRALVDATAASRLDPHSVAARELLTRLAPAPQEDTAALLTKATQAHRDGKFDLAQATYTEAIHHNPLVPAAWANRALLLQAAGQNTQALPDFSTAITLAGLAGELEAQARYVVNRADSFQRRGRSFERDADLELAELLFTQLEKQNPLAVETPLLRARVCLHRVDEPGAIRALTHRETLLRLQGAVPNLLVRDQRLAETLTYRATLWLRQAAPHRAFVDAKMATYLDPMNADAELALADTLFALGDALGAEVAYSEAKKHAPQRKFERTYSAAEAAANAKRYLPRADAGSPDAAEALQKAGKANQEKRYSEALELYTDVSQRRPDQLPGWEGRSVVLFNQKRSAEALLNAIPLVTLALVKGEERFQVPLLLLRARVYSTAGYPAEAQHDCLLALKLQPEDRDAKALLEALKGCSGGK